MKTWRQNIILGWIVIWGLTAGQNLLCFAAPVEITHLSSDYLSESPSDANSEMDRFFKAKEQVFKRNWEKARKEFESYLKDYPKGQLRDEGLYWLASSLNMLSKKGKKEDIVPFKKEAVNKLNELINRHPKSLWRDDGMTLRVEIASQLVLMGQADYRPIIDEAVRSQNKDARQLRLLALRSVADLDESYARPLLLNILNTDSDAKIRQTCVQLLGQNFPDSSFALLQKLADEDKAEEVRKEARNWIERITKRRIPVYLKYDIFGSRLVDDSLYDEFPEGEIKTIPLETKGAVHARNIPDLIRPFFNGKLSSFSSSADGAVPAGGFYLQGEAIKTTNRAGNYQLWIKPDQLDVTEDRITGVVEFRHRQTNERTDVPFQLSKDEKKLLTTRSGNTISILVVQFMDKPPSELTLNVDRIDLPEELSLLEELAKNITKPASGSYQFTFKNLMGWKVSTAREDWSLDDLLGKSNKYDLGQAEAVSSDPEGWTLTGNLILSGRNMQFIGHDAVLLDPSGKTVASANEIIVPVFNPQGFQIKKAGRTESAFSELPDYGPFEYKAVFQITSGVEIRTDREYYDAEEFSRNLISFGRSRASLKDKFSSEKHDEDKKWTLLGDIFWIKDKNLLVGSSALIINPDRQVTAYGLISLSIENPSGYQVLQGKTWKKGNLLEQAHERYTRTYYSTQINGVQGWQVWTVLKSGPLQVGGGTDYGLSRVVRRLDGRDWILIGQITLLSEKNSFLAKQAALINSDGEILYGSQIEVPTENPSGAKIIQK